MRLIVFLFIMLFGFTTLAAQLGEIQGKVKDMEMNGEALPFANVYVFVDGKPSGMSTDMKGFYTIKDLPAGYYTLFVDYVGYENIFIENVEVSLNDTTIQDVELYWMIDGFEPIEQHYDLCGRILKQKPIKSILISAINQYTKRSLGNSHIRISNVKDFSKSIKNNERISIYKEGYYNITVESYGYKKTKFDSILLTKNSSDTLLLEMDAWKGLVNIEGKRVNNCFQDGRSIIFKVNSFDEQEVVLNFKGHRYGIQSVHTLSTNSSATIKLPKPDYYDLTITYGKSGALGYDKIPISACEQVTLELDLDKL